MAHATNNEATGLFGEVFPAPPACINRIAYPLTICLVLPTVAAEPAAPSIRVTNAVKGAPIPYTSLGIKNKPIGTVADAAGRFAPETLQLAAATDTLVVSCVGYQSRRMVVTGLPQLKEAQQPGIALQPKAQALAEVVVRGSGWKHHTVGRDGIRGLTFYNFHLATDTVSTRQLGRGVGTILHLKPGRFVEDAHFYIGGNNFKELKFRLSVGALDGDL